MCENLERVAIDSLNMSDEWEYRRLLELLDLLQIKDVLQRIILVGHGSEDAGIREAADDFSE